MQQDSTVKIIIEKYYNDILRFCQYTLKDYHAAEDCTQETFAILIKKQHSLNLSTNIKSWLFETAVRVMKNYSRKNKLTISIDELNEIQAESPFAKERNDVFDVLSDEEYQLLLEYYDDDAYGKKSELAEKYSMTLSQLYRKVKSIKEKVRKYGEGVNYE